MQKVIRIIVIAATVLTGFSLLLLIAVTPLQGEIARIVYNAPADIMAFFPQFPLDSLIVCFLQVVCVALLIICCGNKKGGIWPEILMLVLLAVVLPAISAIISAISPVFLSRFGAAFLAVHSIVSKISSICLGPSYLGIMLASVACGMSIALKTMSKKQSMGQ